MILAEAALGRHQAHDLADEERVAPGLLVNRRGEIGRGAIDRGRELDVTGDRRGSSPPSAIRRRALHRGEVGERLGQRMMAAELDVAVGPDHQQAGVGQAPGDEAQQQQRWLVGPMQVVEDHDQRPRARGFAEKGRNRIEEAKPRLLGIAIDRPALAEVAETLAELGHDLGDIGGATAELPAQADRVCLHHIRADRLRPGPVRRRPLAFVTASPMHARTTDRRVGRQLLGRPGLADPRVAGEEHELP